MNKADLTEAATTLTAVLAALSSAAKGNTGTPGANLAYAISSLNENAGSFIAAGAVGGALANCFEITRVAGADLNRMRAVYVATAALVPVGVPGKAIVSASCLFALVEIGRILASTTFTSRDDVDAALQQTNAMFEASELLAGQSRATSLYRAIVTLHAAVTADLTQRSYPLPRLITYGVPKTIGALVLAHRLYGDASRAEQIAATNAVFNPAFMPQAGEVLSA